MGIDFHVARSGVITVVASNGNVVLSYKPSKNYQTAVISTSSLKTGNSYSIYTGGTISGDEAKLHTSGEYTKGTLLGSSTISSVVTMVGNARTDQGMMMGDRQAGREQNKRRNMR